MTLRLLSILLFIVAATVPGAAQSARNEADAAIELIGKSAAGINTMSCKFTQTKHLSLLSDKLVSHGKVTFMRPGQLRWEYTDPYTYMFIFNGEKVLVGNSDRNNVIDTRTNRIFGEIARLITGTVTGRLAESKSDFDIEAARNNQNDMLVTLKPRKREVKQLLKSIVLTCDKNSGTVTHITLNEKNGDRTEIELTDISFNKPVDACVFAIH